MARRRVRIQEIVERLGGGLEVLRRLREDTPTDAGRAPPGASWGLLAPPGPPAAWVLFGASWGLLSWVLLDLLGGASWAPRGPSGGSWGLQGPPGPPGAPMRPSWLPGASWGLLSVPRHAQTPAKTGGPRRGQGRRRGYGRPASTRGGPGGIHGRTGRGAAMACTRRRDARLLGARARAGAQSLSARAPHQGAEHPAAVCRAGPGVWHGAGWHWRCGSAGRSWRGGSAGRTGGRSR